MTAINKELYDALREANVSEAKAAAAASADAPVKDEISAIKIKMVSIEARLAIVEKLQWGILLGVIGIVLKEFIA